MDNLVNPQLKGMAVEDLAQRYSESYVLYDNKPVYIYRFHGDRKTPMFDIGGIAGSPDTGGGERTEAFDWTKLNVARPNAGWFPVLRQKDIWPVFVSYPVRKQYKRGLCPRNTIFRTMEGWKPNAGLLLHALLTAPPIVNSRVNDHYFESGQRSVILRPDRAIWRLKDGTYEFYFRAKKVATINFNENALNFHIKNMEQELFEVVDSPKLLGLKVGFEEENLRTSRFEMPPNMWDAVRGVHAEAERRRAQIAIAEAFEGDEEEMEFRDEDNEPGFRVSSWVMFNEGELQASRGQIEQRLKVLLDEAQNGHADRLELMFMLMRYSWRIRYGTENRPRAGFAMSLYSPQVLNDAVAMAQQRDLVHMWDFRHQGCSWRVHHFVHVDMDDKVVSTYMYGVIA